MAEHANTNTVSKIDSGTIARTVLLVVALINQALAAFGKQALPFTDDQVYQLVTIIFTVVTGVAAWWKNNNFTLHARYGQKIVDASKARQKAAKAEVKAYKTAAAVAGTEQLPVDGSEVVDAAVNNQGVSMPPDNIPLVDEAKEE